MPPGTMASSPSSPPEATHFNGTGLSPASPVPLHIPEPSNIPVLQNQIDPVFNLMSTHMEQPLASNDMMTETRTVHDHAPSVTLSATSWTEGDNKLANNVDIQRNQDSEEDGGSDYNMIDEDEPKDKDEERISNALHNHSSPSAVHSIAANEIPSAPTQIQPAPSTTVSGQKPLEEFLQYTHPREPSQDAPEPRSPSTTVLEIAEKRDDDKAESDTDVTNGGVNYDALLDNLSPSTATAPTADSITSITTAAPTDASSAAKPSSTETPIAAIPLPAGLPPRPPPQEKPAIHPNYTPGEDIRSYHYPQGQTSTAHKPYTSQPNNSYRSGQSFPLPASGNAVGANGLPPPPLATFQQPPAKDVQPQRSPPTPQNRNRDGQGRNGEKLAADQEEDEVPWTPEIEKRYAEFLIDEAVYVTEGLWDRFPPGSRLFVGNLFSEKASKRDLFYVFHRYGRLAQISIKNAYGFIQYLDAHSCQRALQNEQGMAIRGRKMHLEISKPQKNSRNASATAAGDNLRAGYGRRSRSPDYNRGPPMRGGGHRGDRVDRGVPPVDPRYRDAYRPMRSPSPRGMRGRDEYRGGRDRSPDRYFPGRRSRSRSPPLGRNGRYRSRSPMRRDMDDDDYLPIPRRDSRDVPEVQMIVIDEVDRTFVAYIEKSFRDRGLRCGILQLPRGVALEAVIKRQILEGVQAVVKIFRQSQVTGKIPLQVFDRRGGINSVRFNEYDELDANIAAELVVRAKSTHFAPEPPAVPPGPPRYPQQQAPPYNNAPQQYGQPPPHQQMPPQHQQQPQQPPPAGGPPNLANLITSMDGPALQKLLATMQQNPRIPQTPQSAQTSQTPDLASLLGNVARPHPPPQQQPGYAPYPPAPQQGQHPQHQQQQAPYGAPHNQPFAQTPGLASILANAGGGAMGQQGGMPQQGMGPQQNVQNIMDQLAKWKQ